MGPSPACRKPWLPRETDSISPQAFPAWQPTSQLPKDLGAEAGQGQGPEFCPLSESLTPKGFQESKKRAGSREEAGARANSHRHFLCWEMFSLLVPREKTPQQPEGGKRGSVEEAVWAGKLVGVGGLP